MDPFISEVIRQGILGVMIAGFVLGWWVPKPAHDEILRRLEVKDKIIERQSALIERLAEQAQTKIREEEGRKR